MVSLQQVRASNAAISSTFPSLSAVFVGGTSGIGEYSLKALAKHVPHPKIYIVGRSQESADRIIGECEKINSAGEYIFIKADVSLLQNVDKVCEEISSKEKSINLLFQTQGTLGMSKETSEGLLAAYALSYASRVRFTQNLLPLLRQSTSLKRVVSVLAGTKEGPIDESDWLCRNMTNPIRDRGHVCSMITLSNETLAKSAPDVTFIHEYPGVVKSNIMRDAEGLGMSIMLLVAKVIAPLIAVPVEESGERHVFLATSAKYPSADASSSGVPLEEKVKLARGSDGKTGSGVYSIDWDGSSAPHKVEDMLANFRTKGVEERLWKHTEEVFARTVKC